MVGNLLSAASKKKGFTAPDGTFYEWTKSTPPTQADVDAIVAFHEKRVAQREGIKSEFQNFKQRRQAEQDAGLKRMQAVPKNQQYAGNREERKKRLQVEAASQELWGVDPERAQERGLTAFTKGMTNEQVDKILREAPAVREKVKGYKQTADAMRQGAAKVNEYVGEGIARISPLSLIPGGNQVAKFIGETAASAVNPVGLTDAALNAVVSPKETLVDKGLAINKIWGRTPDNKPVSVGERAGGFMELLGLALPVAGGVGALRAGAGKAGEAAAEAFSQGLSKAEGAGIPKKERIRVKSDIGPDVSKIEPKTDTSEIPVQDANTKQPAKGVTPPKTEPPSPPKTTKAGPAAETAPPEGQGITHAAIEDVRKKVGWEPRERTKKADADLINEAKKHAGSESDIAGRVLGNEKSTLADSESLALGTRLNKLLDDMDAAKKANDTEAFDQADAAAQKIANALDESGSRQGRDFRARQFLFKNEMDPWIVAHKARKAGASEREVARLTKDAENFQAEVRKVVPDWDPKTESIEDALKRSVADATERAKAEAGLDRMIVTVQRKSGKRTVEAVKAEREAQAQIVRDLVKKSFNPVGSSSGGGVLQSFIENAPEAARAIRKYIELIIEEKKIAKLDDLYPVAKSEIKTLLQKELGDELPEDFDVTDSDVRSIFAKFYETTAKTPNQARQQLEEMRKQAGLIENIERVTAGESAVKGAKPGQPSAIVKSLRKQLNDLLKTVGESPAQEGVRTRLQNILKKLQQNQAAEVGAKSAKKSDLFPEIRAEIAKIKKDMKLDETAEELRLQLESGMLQGPTKRVSVMTNAQEAKAVQIERMRKEIRSQLEQAGKSPLSKATKALTQTIRGTILGSDVGILTRQGLFAWSRPVEAIKATGKAVKAALSDVNLAKIEKEIAERKLNGKSLAPIRKKAGLQITDSLTHPEEMVSAKILRRIGRELERIPVIGKTVGALPGALERFQLAFINSVRADIFDRAVKLGYTEKELMDRAKFINAATGRGNIGQVPEIMNVLMTSPRYEASRWEMMYQAAKNPAQVVGSTAKSLVTGKGLKGVNKGALANVQDMAVTAAEIYGLYKLAELSGYEVDFDPTSSDFLKMRKGDKVWDPSAGLAPRLRDAARIVAWGLEPDNKKNISEVIKGMAVRPISPTIKAPAEEGSRQYQLAQGKSENKIKSPFTGYEESDNEATGWLRFAPIIVQSAKQELEVGGAESATGTGIGEFLGQGMSRYPKPKKKAR